MFSYRHAFHAGNHADVLKHAVLIAILRHLAEKDAPMAVFDTHAGAGLYRLDGDSASLRRLPMQACQRQPRPARPQPQWPPHRWRRCCKTI